LKSSFEYFININQSRSAELLARFADRKLRGEKGVPDTEVEMALEKVCLISCVPFALLTPPHPQLMKLFRHLQGKDLFEAFYKKHLSKRLLLGELLSSLLASPSRASLTCPNLTLAHREIFKF
jgi:cullin 4